MPETSDKLLILGGGTCQLNAFRLAKRRRISTVLFDRSMHAPGVALADEFFPVSTFDREACLEHAERAGVSAVMTLGTDQPVYTAAFLAERLGLPTLISRRCALSVTNKAFMKRVLAVHGLPTVHCRVVNEAELRASGFTGPVVIKPLDNQGQKGVFRCEDVKEAAGLFFQSIAYSRCSRVLLEAYYPSEEVTVSAWVHGGKAQLLTITDRLTFENGRHIGVCSGHRYPSRAAAAHKTEIAALTGRIAAAFQIQEGPLYVQLLIGKQGIKINELACRIGGAFEDVFIPYITGFDILGAVMDAALGRHAAPPQAFDPGEREARVLMPFGRPGRLARLTPIRELLALPGVYDAGYNFQEGDTLPPFAHSGARLSYAVLCAGHAGAMRAYMNGFSDVFQALDEAGESMLLPPYDKKGYGIV